MHKIGSEATSPRVGINSASAARSPQFWMSYEGADIRRFDNGAYVYSTSRVSLNANGSPRAYHPQDIGIDTNANAGYPRHDWRAVLAVDPADPGKPYVATDGHFAGYFVSKTALRDPAAAEIDPAGYVNSELIPYIVFPGAFHAMAGTGDYGDLAMARTIDTGFETAAIVGDGGPMKAPLGEISLALASALGGYDPNPRSGRGAPWGRFEYVVFPGSALTPAWPHPFDAIATRARALLDELGGWPRDHHAS
jgi:hypothetical protein